VELLHRVAQEQEPLAATAEEPVPKRAKPAFVPEEYVCSITHEVMLDPVMAEDGHTYERMAITDWVAKDGTSPITRQPLVQGFIPNRSLRKAIERWQANEA
jgi:hypothetical protein